MELKCIKKAQHTMANQGCLSMWWVFECVCVGDKTHSMLLALKNGMERLEIPVHAASSA